MSETPKRPTARELPPRSIESYLPLNKIEVTALVLASSCSVAAETIYETCKENFLEEKNMVQAQVYGFLAQYTLDGLLMQKDFQYSITEKGRKVLVAEFQRISKIKNMIGEVINEGVQVNISETRKRR